MRTEEQDRAATMYWMYFQANKKTYNFWYRQMCKDYELLEDVPLWKQLDAEDNMKFNSELYRLMRANPVR